MSTLKLHLLSLVATYRLSWNCTQKERRQSAQKARDQLKDKFIASVKLMYCEDDRIFKIHLVELGEGRDHLESQVDAVHDCLERIGDGTVEIEYDIEVWPY